MSEGYVVNADDVISVKASYSLIPISEEISANAQTGDNAAIPFVIIGLVVIAGACGAFAARKYFSKK